MYRTGLRLLCLLLFVSSLPTLAHSAQYQIRPLGTITGIGHYQPHAINSRCEAVGSAADSQGRSLPVYWAANGEAHQLALPDGYSQGVAHDINNLGQAVGVVTHVDGSIRAVIWDASGLPSIIDTPFGTASPYALARAINDAGTVVGMADRDDYRYGFVWNPQSGLTDLNAVMDWTLSVATGINESGDVVGHYYTAGAQQAAFLWSPGSLTQLDAGHNCTSSAWAINNTGRVSGWSSDAADSSVVWILGGARLDLPTLGGTCQTWGINDSGTVVGWSLTGEFPGGNHAVAWDASGAMTQLGTLGGNSSQAFDINNDGVIVGRATDAPVGDYLPVVWTPVPEPASLIAVICGIACCAFRRRTH